MNTNHTGFHAHSSDMSVICRPKQMEELLKEIALSERKKRQIDAFVQTVIELLRTMPDSPEVEVCVNNSL